MLHAKVPLKPYLTAIYSVDIAIAGQVPERGSAQSLINAQHVTTTAMQIMTKHIGEANQLDLVALANPRQVMYPQRRIYRESNIQSDSDEIPNAPLAQTITSRFP